MWIYIGYKRGRQGIRIGDLKALKEGTTEWLGAQKKAGHVAK